MTWDKLSQIVGGEEGESEKLSLPSTWWLELFTANLHCQTGQSDDDGTMGVYIFRVDGWVVGGVGMWCKLC